VISDALYTNNRDTLNNRDVSDPLNLMELGLGRMYCLEADIENNIIPEPRKKISFH
jgi:hypothetical protein